MNLSVKNLLISAALLAAPSLAYSAGDDVTTYRPLSEKGVSVVASRVFKGQTIIEQMNQRVKDVDKGYLSHIQFFEGMKSCKAFDGKIMSYTPEAKISTNYKATPKRLAKGKGAPDTCMLETKTITSTTDFTVSCNLTMKQSNKIANEAITEFGKAIERFRVDGLYSNVSPSATLTKLQQSKTCSMKIDASSFK
jgi:hypothetical protein